MVISLRYRLSAIFFLTMSVITAFPAAATLCRARCATDPEGMFRIGRLIIGITHFNCKSRESCINKAREVSDSVAAVKELNDICGASKFDSIESLSCKAESYFDLAHTGTAEQVMFGSKGLVRGSIYKYYEAPQG